MYVEVTTLHKIKISNLQVIYKILYDHLQHNCNLKYHSTLHLWQIPTVTSGSNLFFSFLQEVQILSSVYNWSTPDKLGNKTFSFYFLSEWHTDKCWRQYNLNGVDSRAVLLCVHFTTSPSLCKHAHTHTRTHARTHTHKTPPKILFDELHSCEKTTH